MRIVLVGVDGALRYLEADYFAPRVMIPYRPLDGRGWRSTEYAYARRTSYHGADLVWYEEPVLADNVAACAEVAQAIRIPVATGENAYTCFEFRDLIEHRAARYLMPDVGHANGFSETLRIGRLAAAHQVPVTPHLVHELSIQVVGTLSNGFLVEFMDWIPPDLFEHALECSDGHFRIPDRPGHGMVLARGARAKYQSV